MLSDEVAAESKKLPGRILTFDIETQRAIAEVFDLWPKYIHIDRVLKATRVLCFSARWHDEDKPIFHATWKDDDQIAQSDEPYRKMIQRMWRLLDEAGVVVTWNGDRFDVQWIEEEGARLGLGRPSPYQSVDLFKVVARRRFKAGLMSLKLDWSARMMLHDRKVQHGGIDLWHDIRHGTRAEQRAAQRLMREYCEHDTALTERLFDEYLPWLPINLALHRGAGAADDELLYCTKCGQTGHLERGNYVYTNAFGYQLYRCKLCGGFSRGKRAKITTELRSV